MFILTHRVMKPAEGRSRWLLLVAACLWSTAFGQNSPWYGIALPPPFDPHDVPAIIGSRGPVPARVPAGEENYPELTGEIIRQDLADIVAISQRSLASRELNSDQIWGRVSGFASGQEAVQWAAGKFRDAGISDVRLQGFRQNEGSSLWLPESWELRLLANAEAGPGSDDVVLQTAVALAPSVIAGGRLTAPLIHVGGGSAAQLQHLDLTGYIAVQTVIPQAHLVFERDRVMTNARDLVARGAVAVINVVQLPGNEMARDMSGCGGPCFNIGGRDGLFLTSVLDQAAVQGNLLQMSISLSAREHRALEAVNAVAVIPGQSPETIILNAHADAWFDGAGDNGDGLAVLVALARHFSRPEITLPRTLVLVASAGHHTPGLNGPANAVAMNPDLFGPARLIINLEHVAQRNLVPARSEYGDGYREYVADAGEAPIVAGVTNSAPFLEALIDQGVQRYGTNFVSGPSTMASGEGGGYRSAGVPIVTTMQAPPLYHTSGEVLEVISTPGLERMARFMAFFVREVAQATPAQLSP